MRLWQKNRLIIANFFEINLGGPQFCPDQRNCRWSPPKGLRLLHGGFSNTIVPAQTAACNNIFMSNWSASAGTHLPLGQIKLRPKCASGCLGSNDSVAGHEVLLDIRSLGFCPFAQRCEAFSSAIHGVLRQMVTRRVSEGRTGRHVESRFIPRLRVGLPSRAARKCFTALPFAAKRCVGRLGRISEARPFPGRQTTAGSVDSIVMRNKSPKRAILCQPWVKKQSS